MISNTKPNQISLFDSLENRSVTTERERERESRRLRHKYKDIISVENLLASWREFLKDKKKKKDVAEFSLHFLDNVFYLHNSLKDKTYTHGEYKPFKISDPKPRDIHKASVRDRLLHHAIYRILSPYFDEKFIFDSYSCRLGKGTHRAMNRFRYFARKVSKNHTKTCWVLKCDIRKFFASIDHQILFEILKKNIRDKDIVWLLIQVISSFNTQCKTNVGLPLGNLTSQLLVNIYMNEFDHFMKRQLKVKYYIRYADDFVILSEDQVYLEKLTVQIYQFLEQKLKLYLHPNKVFVKTYASGVDFLGWVHFPNHRVLRTSTKRRMFKNISAKNFSSYTGLCEHGDAHELSQECYNIIKKKTDEI